MCLSGVLLGRAIRRFQALGKMCRALPSAWPKLRRSMDWGFGARERNVFDVLCLLVDFVFCRCMLSNHRWLIVVLRAFSSCQAVFCCARRVLFALALEGLESRDWDAISTDSPNSGGPQTGTGISLGLAETLLQDLQAVHVAFGRAEASCFLPYQRRCVVWLCLVEFEAG